MTQIDSDHCFSLLHNFGAEAAGLASCAVFPGPAEHGNQGTAPLPPGTAPRDCPQGLPRKTAQVATRLHEALQSNSMACYCAEGWNSGCGGCGGCGGFRPGPKKQILPSPSKSIELDIKTLQARLNTYDLYDNNYNIFSKSRKTGELQVKRIASEGLGSLGCMKFEHEHLGHLGENVACTSLMIFAY